MLWLILLFSVVLAYGFTKLSIQLSLRGGVLDVPNPRSSHWQPIPRLGGLGILAAVTVTLAGVALLKGMGLVPFRVMSREVLIMLAAGLGMAATGLYDDLYHLRPAMKFAVQVILAGGIVALGFRFESLAVPVWGVVGLGLVSIPVTILWLAGFSNIFNFMDGINGLSAATGFAYFVCFSLFAGSAGSPDLAMLATVFAGSCLGFLPHNFPTARTFMGDTGSLLLGITLAGYIVRLAQRSPGLLVPLLLVCSVYLWDSGYTLLRRLRRGENIFRAHRSHLYQRLVQSGQSHATITALYLALHGMMGCLALAYSVSATTLRVAILLLAAFTLTGFTLAVRWREQRAARGLSASGAGPASSDPQEDVR